MEVARADTPQDKTRDDRHLWSGMGHWQKYFHNQSGSPSRDQWRQLASAGFFSNSGRDGCAFG